MPFLSNKAFFKGNGRAQASSETTGFLKILAHRETKVLLGVHIVGAQADTLIGLGCLALRQGMTIHDLFETVFPHPTFAELYKEAAWSML